MPKSTKSGDQRFNRDQEELNRGIGANQTDLARLLDVKSYLVPTSDIVAQLVLQHQVHMHNVLTEGVLARVYAQLGAILSGENKSDDFDHLSAEDRIAIREILNQTGVDLK